MPSRRRKMIDVITPTTASAATQVRSPDTVAVPSPPKARLSEPPSRPGNRLSQ